MAVVATTKCLSCGKKIEGGPFSTQCESCSEGWTVTDEAQEVEPVKEAIKLPALLPAPEKVVYKNVTIRIFTDELAALDIEVAKRKVRGLNSTRSEMIRYAVSHCDFLKMPKRF